MTPQRLTTTRPSKDGAPAAVSPHGPARLSHTAENYLLSLSILQEDGVAPHISQLAAYLRHIPKEEEVGTTLASVSGMVHRMAKEGLLNVTKGKEVVLTPEGQRRARDVVRRHRLAERLLVDMLDVPLERAETEAHQLEHSITTYVLERITAKLGSPQTCPYGRPIYGGTEVAPRPEPPGALRLSDTRPGTSYVVLRIPDEDYPLLRFLVHSDVLPDRPITVEENAPYRGVVDLLRDGHRISVGMDVAYRIRVRPA